MYDFDVLIGELLANQPELDREEILRRIDEKKRTVGAGYLTDQGALFLVAGELGVSLRKADVSSDMRIGDLYIGANDVTVVARVLAVYPVATYNKRDGGQGKYRRLILFDDKNTVRLTVWEEGLEQIEKSGVKIDVLVRVANGYVKQGLDGRPNLNLGKRGKFEVLTDEKTASKLPSITTLVQKIPVLTKEERFVVLEGVVSSEPRYSEFVRSDGSEGSLFQFGLAREPGEETRVVIWSPVARPELRRGQRVRVTSVWTKRLNAGGFEIHGDAGSTILEQAAERVVYRIAATTSVRSVRLLLVVGKDRKVRLVEIGKGVEAPSPNQVVGLALDETKEGRIYCGNQDSLKVVDDAFPELQNLVTKLYEAKEEDAQIMVEVIALSYGSVDEVHLRDETTAKRGEVMVGDDTGETKLVAWRDLSERLSGIQPGERLRLAGVAVKSTKTSGWLLQLSDFSVIEKLRGRA